MKNNYMEQIMKQIVQRTLPEEVLDKIMTLFWEKGHFNTSIDDIIVATIPS